MFLIDISVPRNIDPAVRHVDNAFLFDIDDLKMRVEQNRGERLNEAEKAERIEFRLDVSPAAEQLKNTFTLAGWF